MNQAPKSTGLQENIASLLCYVLGWVTGIIFLIIEPNNKTVKFHAIQSIIVFGAFSVADVILIWIPFIGWIISWLLGVLAFILWILLMYKAYQGVKFKVPIAGDIAEKNAK
jgi:uncharacterized membrane protein